MKVKRNKTQLLDQNGNDLLADVGISNKMEELTKKLLEDFENKRVTLIFTKLYELGINTTLDDEKRRRFKRLSIEYNGSKQTVYYNDGSEEGLRVITFVRKDIPFDIEKFSIGYEETYY